MPPTTILRLKVGSVPVSIELDSGAFAPETFQRYRPFLTSERPAYRVELRRTANVGAYPWQPRLEKEGRRWLCRSSDFAWERRGRRASATIKRTDQALDSFLRTFYSNVCAEAGAQLLHAAALTWKGSGALFAGVSGAGKTTLSRAVEGEPGVARLTDELAWVAREGGGFSVAATPFWGLFRRPERNGRAPLERIVFLGKGKGGPKTIPLAPKDAQRRLMRCLVSFTGERARVEAGWDHVLELTSRVPCGELIWDKHDRPIDVLRSVERL